MGIDSFDSFGEHNLPFPSGPPEDPVGDPVRDPVEDVEMARAGSRQSLDGGAAVSLGDGDQSEGELTRLKAGAEVGELGSRGGGVDGEDGDESSFGLEGFDDDGFGGQDFDDAGNNTNDLGLIGEEGGRDRSTRISDVGLRDRSGGSLDGEVGTGEGLRAMGGSPKNGSPKNGSPKNGSPKNGSPNGSLNGARRANDENAEVLDAAAEESKADTTTSRVAATAENADRRPKRAARGGRKLRKLVVDEHTKMDSRLLKDLTRDYSSLCVQRVEVPPAETTTMTRRHAALRHRMSKRKRSQRSVAQVRPHV